MGKDGRPISRARLLLQEGIKEERRAKTIELVLLSISLLSTSVFLILITTHYLLTGYAAYIDAEAGYITEVEIIKEFPTTFWNGVYGLALRVPGFSEQLSVELDNEIKRSDVFFDCLNPDPEGGVNEIYAAVNLSVDFDTLTPATITELDDYMGCAGREDCASGTYTHNMSIMLGSTNITGIPATYSYRYDGDNDIFEIGILKDGSGNFVFVTVVSSVQKGYSENVTVNYQMLLPTPEYASLTYYFLTDPFEVCPAGGGVGEVIEANVSGYVKDTFGVPLANVSVIFAGIEYITNSSGYYAINTSVTEGNYSIIAQKEGYDDAFVYANITFNITYSVQNITMNIETPGTNLTYLAFINGTIYDSLGTPLSGATVTIGGESDTTGVLGTYSMYVALTPTNHSVIAYKSGYNNNFTIVNFSSQPLITTVNMVLREAVETSLSFETGPYTEEKISNIREEAERNGEDYWISTKEIIAEVRQNTFIEDVIGIYNFGSTMNLAFNVAPSIAEVISLEQTTLSIPSESFGEMGLTIYGTEPLGTYEGNITISGDLTQNIPVKITIVERRMPIETLLLRADLFKENVRKGEELRYKLTMQNLLSDQGYMVYLTARVRDINGSEVYATTKTEEEIESTLTLLDQIQIPKDMKIGEYYLDVEARYLNLISRVKVPFKVTQPVYLYSFLGVPLWIYLAFLSFLSFISLNLFLYKRHLDKKKRYRVKIDYNTLPGPGERNVKMGHLAETKKDAWYEIDKLTVHTIVAGATGMGKSISAQVLIEECLMKNVAVVVFDPTAQWSGMLRKCDDKRMLSFYPKFGLKPTDARGFPGNIRAIKDARQQVDLNKYVEPGHIQIFTLNKLQPKEMDVFVANVIRQIFESDPKEYPQLKTLIVFDEVHRLLPRFGGSGEGFLQIERGAREFRKWGLGLILISQVMNDFVGEIKANINTEIQARTVEEGDLERIKSRYGEEYLKSLVKSEVGVSMFQNAEYNRGLPYFINFRPILHNTRRLSDEELEKYNQYNDKVEDLEYQVEQLEELKVDTFDLKMELKLIKGKIMTGNFAVVDIYLEGLVPRVKKQWEKLGKTPKKKEITLVSLDEIKKSIEKAKAEKEKVVAKEAQEKSKEVKAGSKENIKDKIFESITFDNGAMVSTIKELEELLPTLDDEIFKIHVNDQKNDIADWFKQISSSFAEKLKALKGKEEILKLIKDFKLGEKTPPTQLNKPVQKVVSTQKAAVIKPLVNSPVVQKPIPQSSKPGLTNQKPKTSPVQKTLPEQKPATQSTITQDKKVILEPNKKPEEKK